MATGMKHWLGVVGAALLAVAVWLLPAEPLDDSPWRPSAARARYRALLGEALHVHALIQRTRWSDSLAALTVETAVDGLATGFPEAAAGVTTAGAARFREMLRAHADALDPRDPDVVLGFFVQPTEHAAVPGAPRSSARETEAYPGVHEGTPYCFEVDRRPLESGGLHDLHLVGSALIGFSGCRLHARYGLAGVHVARWLEAGAIGFGEQPAGSRGDERPAAGFVPVPYAGWLTDAPLFGLNRSPILSEFFAVDRCFARHADACVEAVIDPEILRAGSVGGTASAPVVTYVGRSRFDPPFLDHNAYLLGDLEAAFGTEAFARFWRSDAPVPEAFRHAFGVEMGEWLLSWTAEHMGTYRAGPAVPGGALWLSVLVVTLFAGAASATAVFRRVG